MESFIPDTTVTYTYDALDRLTSAFVRDPFNANASQGILQQFGYDAYGNRLSLNSKTVTNWTAGAPPPPVPTTTSTTKAQTYGFDANDPALWGRNQLPTATTLGALTGAAYDLQGNLTQIWGTPGSSATQLTMAYDALGRVASLGDTGHATSQTYGYDDQGLRIKITDSATGKVRYNLYNEARQMIATYEKPSGGSLTWKKDILYLGTKEIAEIDGTSTSVTFVDHLGSPRLSWAGSGTPVKQKFLPFGETLSDPTSAAKFAKGFTNHEQTDQSGLIYMQARFYAPMYGRFLSPDPARDQHFEQTQSWNIYSYVQNDPTIRIDPTGEVLQDPSMIINLEIDLFVAHAASHPPAPKLTPKQAHESQKTAGGRKASGHSEAAPTPGRKIWVSPTPDGGSAKGKLVDDGKGNYKGQCVSLAKNETGIPATSTWHAGAAVQGNPDVKPGTVIAAMKNGADWKSGGHVGLYVGQDANGLHMTDQFVTHGFTSEYGPDEFTIDLATPHDKHKPLFQMLRKALGSSEEWTIRITSPKNPKQFVIIPISFVGAQGFLRSHLR